MSEPQLHCINYETCCDYGESRCHHNRYILAVMCTGQGCSTHATADALVVSRPENRAYTVSQYCDSFWLHDRTG